MIVQYWALSHPPHRETVFWLYLFKTSEKLDTLELASTGCICSWTQDTGLHRFSVLKFKVAHGIPVIEAEGSWILGLPSHTARICWRWDGWVGLCVSISLSAKQRVQPQAADRSSVQSAKHYCPENRKEGWAKWVKGFIRSLCGWTLWKHVKVQLPNLLWLLF